MNKIWIFSTGLLLALLLALMGKSGLAQEPGPLSEPVPRAFTYQGQLNRDGAPVHGNCNLRFALFDAAAGGNQVGPTLTRNGVTISNGLFTIPDLNFGNQYFSQARWLQIQVQCPGDDGYSTLSPRQALTPPPYAFHWGGTWTGPGTGLELYGGGIGIIAEGSEWGVFGQSESNDGIAVYGYANASEGMGVYGSNMASSGDAYGVYGQSYSSEGYGVYGQAPFYGVQGRATANSGVTQGVSGLSVSTSGRGVYGFASATTGHAYGVEGRTNSSEGIGVYGQATNHTGSSVGVFGTANANAGSGVLGWASSPTGANYGVYGETSSTAGYGIYGRAASSTANYGVYSFGNTGATGTKSAVVETQDYGWRHLYAVESPRVLFEDVGSAQLINGRAVVIIDPTFAQTVNLDEPYQVFVTPLGDCGLYVSEKTVASFTVNALDGRTCSLEFDYRIIVTRLGYEELRLAPATDPALLSLPELGEVQP